MAFKFEQQFGDYKLCLKGEFVFNGTDDKGYGKIIRWSVFTPNDAGNINWGKGVLHFATMYWFMAQCGNAGMMRFAGSTRFWPEEHQDAMAKWVINSIESVFDALDGYHKNTRQWTLNLTSHNDNALCGYIKKQPNCKPVHTYRNQAHHPNAQCTWYAWHRNPDGLPEEWGIELKEIPI